MQLLTASLSAKLVYLRDMLTNKQEMPEVKIV